MIWSGVVMIERPMDADKATLCKVRSARTILLDAHRAIVCDMPYSMLSHYFKAEDEDYVCAYAEYKDGHLQLLDRASQLEFFTNSTPTKEQENVIQHRQN